MNFNFYMFGTPQNNFDQYSSDETRKLFEKICTSPKSKIQLVVSRNSSLVYYCYLNSNLLTKNNRDGACLGIGMVLNGVSFLDERAVLNLFDDHFNVMVRDGKIIKLDADGKITFVVDRFYQEAEAIKRYENLLRKNIDNQLNQPDKDYIVNRLTVDNYNHRISVVSTNGEVWNSTLDLGKTQYRNSFFQNKLSLKKIAIPLLIVFILLISIFSIIKSQSKSGARSEKGQIENLYQIEGKYLCNMEYPHKVKLKIELSKDPISSRYLAQFINYNYRDTLFTSDFIINSDGTEISNSTLGQGSIVKNSMGEIEIISKPENDKKWNMRKIQ